MTLAPSLDDRVDQAELTSQTRTYQQQLK